MGCAYWFSTGHLFTSGLALPLSHRCRVLQCRSTMVMPSASRIQLVPPPVGPTNTSHTASKGCLV